ncbi:hypothetical protein BASA81_002180 [Batrachochytrium salamandrivorans]|nr:hypothetical protein BASA81_002180 [Batrachochytrium salamandrivorans]
MDEAFMDMPSYCQDKLHPQSLLMETNWVCGWFQRILKIHSEHETKVLICDRSPLSAVFYTANGNGKLLGPLIQAQVHELRQVLGIEIYTVHVTTPSTVLWERIQQRLGLEPERALYKEDSREWMDQVKQFYDSFPDWDFEVENNGKITLREVMNQVIRMVRQKTTQPLAVVDKALVHSVPPKRAMLQSLLS